MKRLTCISIACLAVACSSGDDDQATQTISAEAGGTVVTPGGIELEIPPGALSEDVEITLAAQSPDEFEDHAFFGARFEPDGLELSSPATLRLPLPDGWEDPEAVRYDFDGADSTGFAELHAPPVIEDGRAVMPVSHFSGIYCAKNCHAGTIRYILGQLEERGCTAAEVLGHVRNRYPGVEILPDTCGPRSAEAVQALLDTFMDDVGGYDEGAPVPSVALDGVIDAAASGDLVALAFTAGQWPQRSGPHQFYRTGYRHSATLELREGAWQIRNTVVAGSRIRQMMAGNTVWYEASRLDEFRELPSAVGVELQACGAPGCLDFATPPEERGTPWTAVRLYVERPGAVAEIGCATETADFPRDYVGNGDMTRTISIAFDDMSSATCMGSGEWAASLFEDGSMRLAGQVDVIARSRGGTTVCDPVDDFFIGNGVHDGSGSFTIDLNYAGLVYEMSGEFDDSTLTVSGFMLERTATIAGFGEATWTEAIDLSLTRQ